MVNLRFVMAEAVANESKIDEFDKIDQLRKQIDGLRCEGNKLILKTAALRKEYYDKKQQLNNALANLPLKYPEVMDNFLRGSMKFAFYLIGEKSDECKKFWTEKETILLEEQKLVKDQDENIKPLEKRIGDINQSIKSLLIEILGLENIIWQGRLKKLYENYATYYNKFIYDPEDAGDLHWQCNKVLLDPFDDESFAFDDLTLYNMKIKNHYKLGVFRYHPQRDCGYVARVREDVIFESDEVDQEIVVKDRVDYIDQTQIFLMQARAVKGYT